MAKIRGYTVEIGGDTTGLEKALKDTNKAIAHTQAQLKDVNKLLKMDPENVELLQQKQRLLNEAIGKTTDKLDALRQAEKQAQKQFERGDIGQEQYDALKREIIATEGSLESFKRDAAAAGKAIGQIDEDPVDDVRKAAKRAGDALDDASRDAADFGDILKAEVIADGIKAIAGGIADLNEETLEYRKIMGTLETSSEAAGYTADETSEAYNRLYGVLGDDQTAATTLANLQALHLDQDKLLELIDQATGAWATYGDSIPIDGLAESINETAKTSKVTGTLADVLNWAGESEDDFNAKLEDCWNNGERTNLIMETLAKQGLGDAAKAWRENNDDIVSLNKAQANFADKTAELSEKVSPAIVAVKEGTNGLLDVFLELTEDVDMDAVAQTINTVFKAIEKLIIFLAKNKEVIIAALAGIGAGFAALKVAGFISTIMSILGGVTTLTTALPALGAAITALTNPIFLISAAVVGFVALIATKGDEIQEDLQRVDAFLQNIFVTDWTTIFGPVLGESMNAFYHMVKNIWDAFKTLLHGVIDFVRGVFSGDWDRAWSGIAGIFEGIFLGLQAVAKVPLNGIIGLMNGMITGINWMIEKINSISWENPFTGTIYGFDIGYLGKIPYLARGGEVLSGSAVVGEAGPELLTVANGRTIVQPLGSSGDRPRPVTAGAGGSSFSFVQNITSARPLDTYEIYRQTQNEGRRIAREIRRAR